MKVNQGTITEIHQIETNTRSATIRLAEKQHIAPGQYFHAYFPASTDQPAGLNLFPGGFRPAGAEDDTFTTAPPVPANWRPGDTVHLYGPLGNGFTLPPAASRIALIDLGSYAGHLLPLANAALAQSGEVALFTDGSFPKLPANIEISPLAALDEAAGWADYLALCGAWEEVQTAKQDPALTNVRVKAQVLVLVPMPCSSLAVCEICAITDRQNKTRLVCEDGPVFDWKEI